MIVGEYLPNITRLRNGASENLLVGWIRGEGSKDGGDLSRDA